MNYKSLMVALCVFSAFSNPTNANDTWPDNTVTLVVGYSAGGTTDILARALSDILSDQTGESCIVEKKAGANSNIGAQYVAKSKADGRTLFVGSTANSINNSLYKDLSFDLNDDFEPVAKIGSVPNLLVVNAKSKIKTVKDYLQIAEENPGELTCASSGIGSAIHMSCELFNLKAGTEIRHIPYKGSANAMADLLGGFVDSSFDNMPTVAANVRSGNLRGLAVTSNKRSSEFPDIPTIEEELQTPYNVESWFGIFAPKNTDQAVTPPFLAVYLGRM